MLWTLRLSLFEQPAGSLQGHGGICGQPSPVHPRAFGLGSCSLLPGLSPGQMAFPEDFSYSSRS